MVSVQDLQLDDSGRPSKFSVTGASTILTQVEVMEPKGGVLLQESEFTLNGEYSITPHNTYHRIHQGGRSTSPREERKELLSYQVLLIPLPRPKGEICVLKLHDGSIKSSQLPSYGLSEDQFDMLTETEPAKVFQAIRKVLCADLPDFVIYARKGTTN